MPQLKAVARVTLGEQVAGQLADMIADNHWKVGERLPPETELCEVLNVGRSTLREALKSLAFIGMVRMRAGDGTYVAEESQGLLHRLLAKGLLKSQKDLEDVCETRILLETELAALAAERRTVEDEAILRDLVEKGRDELKRGGNNTANRISTSTLLWPTVRRTIFCRDYSWTFEAFWSSGLGSLKNCLGFARTRKNSMNQSCKPSSTEMLTGHDLRCVPIWRLLRRRTPYWGESRARENPAKIRNRPKRRRPDKQRAPKAK